MWQSYFLRFIQHEREHFFGHYACELWPRTTQLNSTQLVVTVGDNAMTSLTLRRHAAVHRPRFVCWPGWVVELSWIESRRRRRCEFAITLSLPYHIADKTNATQSGHGKTVRCHAVSLLSAGAESYRRRVLKGSRLGWDHDAFRRRSRLPHCTHSRSRSNQGWATDSNSSLFLANSVLEVPSCCRSWYTFWRPVSNTNRIPSSDRCVDRPSTDTVPLL